MSSSETLQKEPISVRLASSDDDVKAAQELRYNVFYEEYDAKPSAEIAKAKRDFDRYDDFADHLIVIDHRNDDAVVGTYRLLRREHAEKAGGFYSASEYDLSRLLNSEHKLLELGRSCIMPNYRAGPVLQLLWEGIAHYIMDHDIDIMFGCASFHNTNIEELAEPLSYMYHHHLAPEELRVKALADKYIGMNILPEDKIEPKKILPGLPPLIKGYLRVGSMIGDGAVLDPEFSTIDVCVIAQTAMVTDRYRKHYERKTQRELPGSNSF